MPAQKQRWYLTVYWRPHGNGNGNGNGIGNGDEKFQRSGRNNQCIILCKVRGFWCSEGSEARMAIPVVATPDHAQLSYSH